jgi:predicted nucleic acid-binding protein
MTDYIVDASIVIQRLIHEAYTPNVIALFKQIQSTARLYVPEFCFLECVNVLWKHVRFQGMPQAQAEQLVKDLIGLSLQVMPATGLYARALQVGLKHELAIYDSVYITLAELLRFPLITVDQAQIRAATLEGITVKPVTDFKA